MDQPADSAPGQPGEPAPGIDSAAPSGPGGRMEPGQPPPGLRTQFGATRGAAMRLVRAHIDLARTELGEIMDEVKRAAALIGGAVALLLFIVILLPVGAILWFGEWVFGSMGWGVLHGTELCIGVAVALVLVALGRTSRAVAGWFALSIVIGVILCVVFGSNALNTLWGRIGESVVPAMDPAYRPLVVGAIGGAIVLGVLGLLFLGVRGGAGGAVGGLFLGAIAGLFVGAFTAITFGAQVGTAVGIAIALAAWPILLGVDVARRGIDTEALKARFYPSQTIDTTKETIEWVRQQTPLGPKS